MKTAFGIFLLRSLIVVIVVIGLVLAFLWGSWD